MSRPQRTEIIAEAGVNHNGSLDMARRLVDAAADAGANAIKFQSFKTEALVSPDAPKAGYQKETTGTTQSQQDMLRALELSEDDHQTLAEHCRARKITFLSTPFDFQSARMLETLGIDRFKVGSGELTNLPLLRQLASLGKPLILSTGMSTIDEVADAVNAVTGVELTLMHCVSNYPAKPEQCNLNAMRTMAETFKVPIGWSDHTIGPAISFAAVALGACVVEKHITLDRALPGPDHNLSMEPAELTELIQGIRAIESALGDGNKVPTPDEMEIRRIARRSLAAIVDIPADTVLSTEMLGALRPGTGLSPAGLDDIVGRRTREAIARGTLISMDLLD